MAKGTWSSGRWGGARSWRWEHTSGSLVAAADGACVLWPRGRTWFIKAVTGEASFCPASSWASLPPSCPLPCGPHYRVTFLHHGSVALGFLLPLNKGLLRSPSQVGASPVLCKLCPSPSAAADPRPPGDSPDIAASVLHWPQLFLPPGLPCTFLPASRDQNRRPVSCSDLHGRTESSPFVYS